MYSVWQAIQRQGGFLLSQITAMAVDTGEEVMLSYSEICSENCGVKVIDENENKLVLIINAFYYHVSLSDYTKVIEWQFKANRSVEC
jgi:hypothetical protein